MPRSSPPLARVPSAPPLREREQRPALRERLAKLTRTLKREHDEYEQAAQAWTPEAEEKKRDARKAREETLHAIEELLEREGEGDRLARLERLPFAAKLVELEAWIVAPAPSVEHRREVVPPPPRASAPVSAVVSVAAVVATIPAIAATKPARAAPPPVPKVPSPIPDRAPAASAAVAQSRLPVIRVAAHKRRRWVVAGVTTMVALVALVLAIGGWQAVHRTGAPTVDEPLALADHTPETFVVALAPHTPGGDKPCPCLCRDVEASPPHVERPATSSLRATSAPMKRPVSPPEPAAPPKPRLAWPSVARGSP
jgi:hypothetical protein